jgi:SAM-dependent methyltransferase
MARTGAFDRHSQKYEEWFSDNYYVYQSELEAVRNLLPARGRGLEVGVGSGRFAEPLGIKTGIEPSEAMRRLAESRGIEVHNAVAENLPFCDACFDFVLMVTTICFVDDVDNSFQEVRRVLKSNGSFVIGFVDKDSPLGATYQKRKRRHVFYREATFYGAAEVLSLLRHNRFEETQVIQTVFGRPQDIKAVQGFRTGHGQGGFVAVRAVKGQ